MKEDEMDETMQRHLRAAAYLSELGRARSRSEHDRGQVRVVALAAFAPALWALLRGVPWSF
jgi:hypothetical protein